MKLVHTIAVLATLFILSVQMLSYQVFCILLGGIILGFASALILDENKYVSFIANFISTKAHKQFDASSLYDKDNIQFDYSDIALDTMWFNVGYWKDVKPTEYKGGVNPFVLACQEMTSLLTRVVDLNDGSFILDVGCGCGEQDIFIANNFTKCKILGVELSPYQVEYAKTKAAMSGIAERVHFEVGNATDLAGIVTNRDVHKFLEASGSKFDVVLALDCAYHFNLRTNFLEQACNALRIGGKIGLADVCLADGVSMNNLNPVSRYGLRVMLKRLSIPPENLVDMATYKRNFEECGFTQVVIRPITEHVFAGLLEFTQHVESYLGPVVKPYRLNKLRGVISFLKMVITRRLLEYVIVSGVKTGDTLK